MGARNKRNYSVRNLAGSPSTYKVIGAGCPRAFQRWPPSDMTCLKETLFICSHNSEKIFFEQLPKRLYAVIST